MSVLAMPGASKAVRYAVAPVGNEARDRVREQLMHHDLPNDAVGKTTAITGGISLTPAGAVDTAASKLTIDVASLKSGQERREYDSLCGRQRRS
ncbi:MAG: hypothetical protein ABI884_10275 [Gemmatimonadota bacterium]